MSKLSRRGGSLPSDPNRRLPPAQSESLPPDPLPEAFESPRGMGRSPISAALGRRVAVRGYLTPPPLMPSAFKAGYRVGGVPKSLHLDPRTKLCLGRKKRREILFALKRSGKNKRHGAGGSYRRTINSNYTC